MKKVLFVGDINVDIILGGLESPPIVDREITCSSYDLTLGSTAVICACAYASLGGSASFIGLAGNDEHGDFMLHEMEGFGINTRSVRRTDTVRTGVTVNLIHRDSRTQVTFPGTIAEFDGADLGADLLRGFDHIHFAGPYQQTKLKPHIGRLLADATQRGMTTSVDPQWDAEERWEHMGEWLPHMSYLFVNEAEACSIAGTKDPQAAVRTLAGQTRCPIVKTGKNGCRVFLGDAPLEVPTCTISIVDSTGAGDSFDAGFLFAVLEKGLETLEACAFANAVGTRSCLFVGGVNARSTYEDIIHFIRGNQ